jgi:hypothetical protein
MRRPVLAALGTAAALIVGLPAIVLATPPVGQHDNGFSKLDERYLAVYVECWHSLGSECGRNIVDDGLAPDGAAPSDARVADSTATMERWLHPPKPEPTPVATSVSESVAPASAPSSVATSSSGGCPSYMAGEASSPDAVNPSSGAAGCYQVLPSTAAAMGSACSDVNSSSCVAAICASSGNGAWAASGATPCDYVRP